MFIIGLTGGIATGKSTVSKIFKNLGCAIVDADEIAREVVKPHQSAWKAIVKNFGPDVLLSNKEIDREKLGQIIFADNAKRHVLNRCTHPAIYRSILWKLCWCLLSGRRFVILDLPLLYETKVGLYLIKDVIVVYCNEATQLRRLMERNNFSQSDAEQRIDAQMSLNEKCRRATYVIDNSFSRERTEEQVRRLHEVFHRSYAHVPVRLLFLLVVVVVVWLVLYGVGAVLS